MTMSERFCVECEDPVGYWNEDFCDWCEPEEEEEDE